MHNWTLRNNISESITWGGLYEYSYKRDSRDIYIVFDSTIFKDGVMGIHTYNIDEVITFTTFSNRKGNFSI